MLDLPGSHLQAEDLRNAHPIWRKPLTIERGGATARTFTIDDVAKIDYPTAVEFTRPMLHDGYDFSFSGLKTAARRAARWLVAATRKIGWPA